MKKASANKGYNLPEGYFDHLPDQLLSRLGDTNAAAGRARKGYKVPEGYFDNFADRLEGRMAEGSPKVRRLWTTRLGWIGAAAAAVILLFVLFPQKQEAGPQFADLNGEAIATYLGDGEWEPDSGELAEAFPLEEIALEDFLDAAPDDTELMDYLEIHTESEDEFYWDNDE